MNVKLISAGAGSGKTYRLTEEIVKKLKEGVPPSGILATTFTKKAAAELRERVRQRLIKEGLFDAAEEVSNALIGTVNGLGTKLLQRFSFEAGLSPNVQVMDDSEIDVYFRLSLARILTADRVDTIQKVAGRLGLQPEEGRFSSNDWRKDLSSVCNFARSNNFKGKEIEISFKRSIETIEGFFEESKAAAYQNQIDRLRQLIDFVIEGFDPDLDSTKGTSSAIDKLKKYKQNIDNGKDLKWSDWLSISKAKPGKKSKDLFFDLQEFAHDHFKFEAFQNDLKSYIKHLFDITRQAIEEFDIYKKNRGLIDYIDMEAMLDGLLQRNEIQEVLRDELKLIIVDEFQDTSPLQLKLFLKLDELAGDSIWVGDPKQSIYGFRGADPILMSSLLQEIKIAPEDIQKFSYRSRMDLVNFSNCIFTRAFSDLPEEQVALIAKRSPKAELEEHQESDEMSKAIHNWHFPKIEGKNRLSLAPYARQITEKIVDLLHDPPVIQCRKTGGFRNLRAGDIGILCRTNKSCLEFSKVFPEFGLKASIAKAGLMDTIEVRLIISCLYHLLDSNDSLSTAELLFLRGEMKLEEILNDRVSYILAGKKDYKDQWMEHDQWIQILNNLEIHSAELSITELLELILEDLPIRDTVMAMNNPDLRMANLDQLFLYARQFEGSFARLGKAATIDGFLLFMQELNFSEKDNQAASEDADAIHLLTYHKSKGLEFPFVVLFNLNEVRDPSPFGISVQQGSDQLDLKDVLADRWIRFIPNPYGVGYKNSALFKKLKDTPIMEQATFKSKSESARLLYVGITRARDYMVIPSSEYNKSLQWLNQTFSTAADPDEEFLSTIVSSPLDWKSSPVLIRKEEVDPEMLKLDSFITDPSEVHIYAKEKKKVSNPSEQVKLVDLNIDESDLLDLSDFMPIHNLSLVPAIEQTEYYKVLVRLIKHRLVTVSDDNSLSSYIELIEPGFNKSQIEGLLRTSKGLSEVLNVDGEVFLNYPFQLEQNDQLVYFDVDICVEGSERRVYLFMVPGVNAKSQKEKIRLLSLKLKLMKQTQYSVTIINVATLGVANYEPISF
jgi:ATP-dependent helicase/nuclease subunit A